MQQGEREEGDKQFMRAFKYMNGLVGTPATATQYNPFNVWKERESNGGHMNFLTGAGGFLQNIVNGYGGLLAHASRLDMRPVLPPFTGFVRMVGLHYAGSCFTLNYTQDAMTLALLHEAAGGLTINTSTAAHHQLVLGSALTLPAHAFSLMPGQ